MSRIFVVEDEPDIASVLVDYLRAAGLEPLHYADGDKALQDALARPPALMLLDVMLPGRDGLSVLRTLRAAQPNLPVILVTARVEEVDRLLGLELGADDYVCKPFSPREVVARVKAVLRRATPSEAGVGWHIDETQGCVTLAGRKLQLTRKELQLLAVLARRPGRIYSRAQLLELVYPDAPDTSERVLDSHVKNLRKKLSGLDPGHEWIRSVYGVGFGFEPR